MSRHNRHAIGDIDRQSREAGTQGSLHGGGSYLGPTTGVALLGGVAAVALVADVIARASPPLLALLAMRLCLGFGVVELLRCNVQVGVHLGGRQTPGHASSSGRDPSGLRNLSWRGTDIGYAGTGGSRVLVVKGMRLGASSKVGLVRGSRSTRLLLEVVLSAVPLIKAATPLLLPGTHMHLRKDVLVHTVSLSPLHWNGLVPRILSQLGRSLHDVDGWLAG